MTDTPDYNINRFITSLVLENPGLDDNVIARAVLDEIARTLALTPAKRKILDSWLWSPTINLVANADRQRVRRLERAAFAPGPRPARGKPVKIAASGREPDVAKLRTLVNQPVSLGRKLPKVMWGVMTVAEHEQCIASLSKHAAGVQANIARHLDTIQLIKKYGVTCLTEVFEAMAA